MSKTTYVSSINVTQKKEDSNLQIIFSSGRRKAKIDVLGNPILIECTSCKQMLPLCKFGKSSKAWFNHKEKCMNCLKLKKDKHSSTITKKYAELSAKNTILLNLSYDFSINRNDITLLDYGMEGIYSIYDDKGIVIYIGQTNCIKHRLLQYLSSSAHIKQIGKLLDTVCLIITFDKWDRDIIESYLIRIYRPIFNIDKNTNWNSYLKTRGLVEDIAINRENIKSNYPLPSVPTKQFDFTDRLKHRTFEIIRRKKLCFPITPLVSLTVEEY